MTVDLGRRELAILHTLGCHLRGIPCPPCCLTAGEYTSAVLSLRSRGLCGADVRSVHDDPDAGPVPFVDRVWLTAEGRQQAAALAA